MLTSLVSVLAGYWWIRFDGNPSELLPKVVLLSLFLSCYLALSLFWLIRHDQWKGRVELMFTVPKGIEGYCRQGLVLSLAPLVPPVLILFAWLISIPNGVVWTGSLTLILVNTAIATLYFAWRSFSASVVVLLAVCFSWTVSFVVTLGLDFLDVWVDYGLPCFAVVLFGLIWYATRWIRFSARKLKPKCGIRS